MDFYIGESQDNGIGLLSRFTGTLLGAKRAATRAQMWQGTELRIEDDLRRIIARKQWRSKWENTHLAYDMGLCKTHHFQG